MSESNESVYQFFKELNIPLYIKVIQESQMMHLKSSLELMQFSKLTDEEAKKIPDIIKKERHAKVLKISVVSPVLSKKIGTYRESDQFGAESVEPNYNYKVYRYKGQALMIFSLMAKEWQLHIMPTFGSESGIFHFKTVINRFLSLALAPMGIVGFWGVPVDDGIVIQRQINAKAEAVFFDLKKQRILTLDGSRAIFGPLTLIRLDNMLRNRHITMRSEELYSFLTYHATYLDYPGISLPIQEMTKMLSKLAQGIIYPADNFKPRSEMLA